MRSGWEASLDKIGEEVEHLKGSDVVIGVVVTESQISMSGALKSGGRTAFGHRGAEVSFDTPKRGRLVFHTDAYDDVTQNLRAIGLGLEALRAVDRHGITTSAEQYAGFQMLTSGVTPVERGRELVTAAGGLTAALKRHHPDAGGDAADFAAVDAFRKAFAGRTG
jgi:hypothetical protein